MRHAALLALAVGCAIPAADAPPAPAPLRAMTYNMLCSFCDPSYAPWEERLVAFEDLFERHAPDLVGTQELATVAEVEQVRALLDGFEAVFHGDQGDLAWPDAAVFYDAARFELVERGEFWLSPTPEEPFSIGFAGGPQLPRVVTWVRLRDRPSGVELAWANTHFDNNPPSQDRSAPLLLERGATLAADVPLLVTGDFNSQTYDPAFAVLTEGVDGAGFHLVDTQALADTWRVEAGAEAPPAYDLEGRIDHLFVDAPRAEGAAADLVWSAADWVVDATRYGEPPREPSDHRAMSVELRLVPVSP